MQKVNKITQPFLETLMLCYFGECWACPGMPEHCQWVLPDLTKASMDM